MAIILYGKPVAEQIKSELVRSSGDFLTSHNRKPTLAIVQIGTDEASAVYVRAKTNFAASIGVDILHRQLEESIDQEWAEREIASLGSSPNVDGIILQLPVPSRFVLTGLLEKIPKEKDTDAILGIGESTNNTTIFGATAKAVLEILTFYGLDYLEKKIVVIGQGRIAGRAISDMFDRLHIDKGLQTRVVRCDINTPRISIMEECRRAEIIVTSVGVPNFLDKNFVMDGAGQCVIDVGISRIEGSAGGRGSNGSIDFVVVGDSDFGGIESLVGYITPVPGGVGPVTVACLFQNLLIA